MFHQRLSALRWVVLSHPTAVVGGLETHPTTVLLIFRQPERLIYPFSMVVSTLCFAVCKSSFACLRRAKDCLIFSAIWV
ncbi:MAG: hypothetical protein J6U05_06385, partial [Neisseriaceae bacterium]|nr:hypothetical protein [Neisseriaceae bacterium]